MGKVRDGIKKTQGHWPAVVAVLLGIALRAALSRFMFLQADEEIFSYDAYYFILGRSLDYIVGKIGAYLLYPMVLAGWFKIFGVSLFGARLFTVLCWGIIMLVFYLIILRLTGNRRWALIGTLLLAILPYPLRYGHVALSEPFAWTFITVSIYLLLDGMERERWWTLLLAGSLVAVAFFARRSALILPLFIVPGLIWVNRGFLVKAVRQALVYGAGFVLPFAIGLGVFISLFGLDRLVELGFLSVPNMTQGWVLDLSTSSTFDSALYAIQPTIWKSLPILVPFLAGCMVLLASLHRNIWRVVYSSCLLWPAFIRMAFDGEASSIEIFIVTMVPLLSILPFLSRLDPQKAAISLALLLGSAVAFSTTTLSLDIWNVILYTGVGAILLIYLDDRLDSQLGSFVLLGAGLFLLTLICFREPQITTLLSYLVPIAGAAFFLLLPRDNAPNVPLVLKVTGLVLLQIMVLLPDLTGLYLPFVLILPLLGLLALGDRGERLWKVLRYLSVLGALAFIPMVPKEVPQPMIISVLLIIPLLYIAHILPRTGWARLPGSMIAAVVTLAIIWRGSGSIVLGGMAAVLSGTAAAIATSISDLSRTWKHRVPERASVVLFLIVIAYIAFYIYYAWTEVYLMELIVPASMITALFLFVLFGPGIRIYQPKQGKVRSAPRTFLPERRLAVMTAVLLAISVPISVGAFLEDDWFKEGPMDQRPYMSTIIEIADWIKENTEENEKVLAWHCYAVQADRETIIEVSNAARYDGRKVIDIMGSENVSVFVRCYYTNHGLWEDQPYFQDFILENFRLDRTVDGNECYLRTH